MKYNFIILVFIITKNVNRLNCVAQATSARARAHTHTKVLPAFNHRINLLSCSKWEIHEFNSQFFSFGSVKWIDAFIHREFKLVNKTNLQSTSKHNSLGIILRTAPHKAHTHTQTHCLPGGKNVNAQWNRNCFSCNSIWKHRKIREKSRSFLCPNFLLLLLLRLHRRQQMVGS